MSLKKSVRGTDVEYDQEFQPAVMFLGWLNK